MTAPGRHRDPDRLEQVAHELRTPVTAVRACCEILLANPDLPPVERESFLTAILRESRRLGRLVDGLLADPTDHPAGQPLRIDLAAIAREAAGACRPLFLEKAVQLSINLPEQGLWMRADPDRITQLIVNLLANALHACKHGTGRVWLHCGRVSADALDLSVLDNGPGIPENQWDRIFEPFQQISAGTRTPAGTGLGLSICRQIVEAAGGTIGVERHHATGALFRCRLPVDDEPGEADLRTA